MDIPASDKEQQLQQQIRLEEIRLLHGGTPFSFTASFVIALIIYSILLDHVVSERNLNIWLFCMLSILFIRSVDSFLFNHASEEAQQDKRWRLRFFAGTGIAGFCWGLLPWLGYTNEIEYFAFIIICQIGVIAGSLSTLAYRWETMALFLLPSSLMLVLRILIENNAFSNATAIVLAVFIFFSLSAGKRIFNNTQQNIRLRLEADNRERAIELMHQKQALHLQNTPLAIIEFDLDLNVTEWNRAAEHMFGYRRIEAIGENILRLILPRDSSDAAEKLWQKLLNHEAVIGAVIENKSKTREKIFCEWFITPLTEKDNKIVGIAAMALDINDKKRHEEAIIKARDEAEKASRAKSEFLSSMSHELRTPLNAILGFTQLMKFDKTLSEKQRSHIEEIGLAGNLLLELVNQILDLARIEKGHLQLSMEQVGLDECFNECRSMISPLAEQNQIDLNFNSSLNGYVIADYTRLKQVMLNLLSNAIKYNRVGGSIHVDVKQRDSGNVYIAVIDTGPGISEELQQQIFQPFNRLNAASNIEGTGIGLSISKQLIEMMGGVIGVISQPGEGSEFWLELPGKLDITTAVERETPLPHTPAPEARSSSSTILAAEDNPTNQTLILNQLKALGYQAELVNNGQEALNAIATNQYQLLLTDCNMPLVNGYELAKTLRQRGYLSLPIIALTADAFPERKADCLKAGMNDLITKPVDLATLKDMLEKYLKEEPVSATE